MGHLLRVIQILFTALVGCGYGMILLIRNPLQSKMSLKGEILRYTLERLGPTFIKIGQILSSRPDLVSKAVAEKLIQLQTQVKSIKVKYVKLIWENNFNNPINIKFQTFDYEPVACGSIAQVHHAVLPNGIEVAVKIKRPGIEKIMKKDFEILYWLVKIVNKFAAFKMIPIHSLLNEIEKAIIDQVDFHKEMNNARKFKANFQNNEMVYIPEIFPAFCSEDVITMTWVSKSVDLDLLSSSNRRKISTAGLKMLYKMIFVDGFIHADLHMGNIQFETNRIVLFDFGLISVLEPDLREQFRLFFFAMATNNGSLCAEIIIETAQVISPDFDTDKFTQAISQRLSDFSGQSAMDFEVVNFAVMLFDVQRQFKIKGSVSFTMTIIALLMFEGVLKQLDKTMDFQHEAVEFLLKLKHTEYKEHQRKQVHDILRKKMESRLI